jgi:hypothetical protein
MSLSDYVLTLTKQIEEYSKTGLLISSEIRTDFRTEKIGLINGTLIFIDESKLFFTEYVDARYKVEKLTYSYHYQDTSGQLIFRYDNASHNPALNPREHKHVKERILRSNIPELQEILEEILGALV